MPQPTPPRESEGRTGHSEVCMVGAALSAAEGTAHPRPRLPGRSPRVQSTTCLGLHLVTGSMVKGSLPAGLESAVKSCCPRPLSFPGGRAPRLSRAPSRLHGRGQRVIAARPSPGTRGSGAAAPPAATVQGRCPSSPASRGREPGAAAGTRPRTPGVFPRGTLRLRGSAPAAGPLPRALGPRSAPAPAPPPAPRSPGCPLRVRRRPRAFPPAGPTSRASLSAARSLGAERSRRSGYKVSAPVAAPGIKEEAGPRRGETRGTGGPAPSARLGLLSLPSPPPARPGRPGPHFPPRGRAADRAPPPEPAGGGEARAPLGAKQPVSG